MSVKLIALCIPPMTVAGFLWVAREVHGRLPPTAALAVPFAFGQPFMFGFLNYALSMALAFLAFGLWLRLARLGKFRLRAFLFVPISFLVFICHTFGWGTLGLMCFSAEAVRQHDKGISWWKAGMKAVPHAAVMAGPLLLMLLWRSGVSQGLTGDIFNFSAKLAAIASALRDRWQVFDILGVALALIVIVEGRFRPQLGFSRNLAFSALVLLAVFLLMPRIVFGSAYADMRIVTYMFALAMLSVRFKGETEMRFARILAVVATAYALVFLGAKTVSMKIAADRHAELLEVLDHVPRGAAMINLIGEPCQQMWQLPRDTHVGGMAIVRRHAFSNDQWAIEGANLLQVKFKEAAPFEADSSQMIRPIGCGKEWAKEVDVSLREIPRNVITHVWTVDLPPHDPKAFAGYRLEWTNGPSRLYVRDLDATGP